MFIAHIDQPYEAYGFTAVDTRETGKLFTAIAGGTMRGQIVCVSSPADIAGVGKGAPA